MSDNQQDLKAHHLMRASLALFERRFDELTGSEKQSALLQAEKSLAIEALALESPQAAGVVIPPRSLGQTVEDVKSRYDSPMDFEQDLRRNGLSEEILCRALERELMVEAVLNKVALDARPVTDEEVRDWYDRHPEKFALPETRTVRHILITINEDIPENNREAALTHITEIRSRCDGTSEQFNNLAQLHSECPSALEGGLIGRVPRGKLYKQLDQVLFDMKVDEISEVVESEIGFHILYCEKIHKAEIVTCKEASAKIQEAMTSKRIKKTQTLWLAALGRDTARRGNQ